MEINNDINPKLESLLKKELTNRAEKLQTIEKWKKEEKQKHRFALPAAISGIVAILVAGLFVLFNNGKSEQPSLDENVDTHNAAIYRGGLVAPEIYKEIESGNKTEAMQLIDSSREECLRQLNNLQTMKVDADHMQEVEDRQLMLKQELHELKLLKKSIK